MQQPTTQKCNLSVNPIFLIRLNDAPFAFVLPTPQTVKDNLVIHQSVIQFLNKIFLAEILKKDWSFTQNTSTISKYIMIDHDFAL